MSAHPPSDGTANLPSAAVLLLCLLLLGAGYALAILRGGDSAATTFLRNKTEASLRQALKPQFSQALQSAGALTALDGAVAKYGAGALKTDTKTWLADEATTGALNGLFYYLAREEQAIRRDPVKRTSDLLRKVFGG